ncbi:hypothetical protein Ptr902_11689 [Pyrenophora tritici-repentis]|nr:hypothetical protein Ptr902_13534 [Pyrenophora tritici-repentis]KAI2476705.1 hypothetical protein Ptr902_11689 [Pyrenophora tritici-repentis]
MMVSLKSLFFVALCGVVYATPVALNEAKELSVPIAKAVDVRNVYHARKAAEVYDTLPVQKRSLSLPNGGVPKLQARGVDSGAFNVEWTLHLDHARDFVIKAVVTFVQGQVFSASGTGVYASPVVGLGNGQGQFRVSYLSGNAVYTAVARIIFDIATGAVVAAFDEGVEKNGHEIRSNVGASFKKG